MLCVGREAEVYLHFVEDEFVPYAVVPDDAVLHLSELPLHGEVQQPFLKGRLGSTLNLEVLGSCLKQNDNIFLSRINKNKLQLNLLLELNH